jgi:salicylate biosynthesis isochorismate synthase/menaquinone-specific isochorismate synthase
MALWGKSRRATGSSATPQAESGFGAVAYTRLATRIDAALDKARTRGRVVVVAVTVPVPAGIDPLEHVAAAKADGERWTSFAQPARDDLALATLGSALTIVAAGADRFDSLARQTGEALEASDVDDLFDDPDAPPGSGVVWTGGFGFSDDDPWGDGWRGTPSAEFALPAASITRRGGDRPAARLTLTVAVQPDSDATELLGGVEKLVERLDLDSDLSTPAATLIGEPTSVASAAPPEHFEQAVERATAQIKAGEIEKIVLAREVVVRRDAPIDSVNALRRLRERFPECTTFAVGSGSTVFVGASPELLIRREGRRASTMALAGSMRRGEDEAMDRHLGQQLLDSEKDNLEHGIVVKRIERTLGRISAWVAAGEKPELVRVKNIQHLATPIRAQLTQPKPVIELAGLLHPTPAVGGEPWPEVASSIRSLEGFDRGWYTGGVGWMDLLEDGEFHVALRSALIDGTQARLFVGAGIVGDSVPADELAETETKLQALLPVLRDC